MLEELLGGNRGHGHDVVRVDGMTHTEQEAEESQREGTEHDPRNVARRAARAIERYFAVWGCARPEQAPSAQRRRDWGDDWGECWGDDWGECWGDDWGECWGDDWGDDCDSVLGDRGVHVVGPAQDAAGHVPDTGEARRLQLTNRSGAPRAAPAMDDDVTLPVERGNGIGEGT